LLIETCKVARFLTAELRKGFAEQKEHYSLCASLRFTLRIFAVNLYLDNTNIELMLDVGVFFGNAYWAWCHSELVEL